jgi:hypothetical protein
MPGRLFNPSRRARLLAHVATRPLIAAILYPNGANHHVA